MIQTAGEAKRCNLLNGNTPTAPSLSESDRADCESFLGEVFAISSALGITVFEKPEIKISQQRCCSSNIRRSRRKDMRRLMVSSS
jgi:hypothetical protein